MDMYLKSNTRGSKVTNRIQTFKSLTWERWAESLSVRACRLGAIREKTRISSGSDAIIARGVEYRHTHQTELVQIHIVNTRTAS